MTDREQEIIELLRREVKPALGCTEPIAVALATAKAAEILAERCGPGHLPDEELEISAEVSGNILKNGMGVGIPGTGMVGLHIAAALGGVCGRSAYGLEVLHDLCPESVEKAKKMVAEGRVKIRRACGCGKLFVKASVSVQVDGSLHCGEAVIRDSHDSIVQTRYDGQLLDGAAGEETGRPQGQSNQDSSPKDTRENIQDDIQGCGLSVKEIYDFARTVDFKDIRFILVSRDMNLKLAEEGLQGEYGLRVGRTVADSRFASVFGNDFMSHAMALTAAASDARMAGCTLPAMSNSGSGNQGITVTLPVVAFALRHNVSDETLARALVLSHLTAIHIKTYLGRLSALCGCVVASTGSSCGLVFLNDGTYGQICDTIKNMIGNITGMVCDGAKTGCAMKVASGVSCAIQSAVLALDGICISANDGIIENDIEKTIRNLGKVGSVGMQDADSVILDIMSCK